MAIFLGGLSHRRTLRARYCSRWLVSVFVSFFREKTVQIAVVIKLSKYMGSVSVIIIVEF